MLQEAMTQVNEMLQVQGKAGLTGLNKPAPAGGALEIPKGVIVKKVG
jgi:hypothetical protein